MYIHVDVGHYVYGLTLIVSYIIMIIMLFVPLYYYNQHVVSAQPLPERERERKGLGTNEAFLWQIGMQLCCTCMESVM